VAKEHRIIVHAVTRLSTPIADGEKKRVRSGKTRNAITLAITLADATVRTARVLPDTVHRIIAPLDLSERWIRCESTSSGLA
jgi:hypothetical protein